MTFAENRLPQDLPEAAADDGCCSPFVATKPGGRGGLGLGVVVGWVWGSWWAGVGGRAGLGLGVVVGWGVGLWWAGCRGS